MPGVTEGVPCSRGSVTRFIVLAVLLIFSIHPTASADDPVTTSAVHPEEEEALARQAKTEQLRRERERARQQSGSPSGSTGQAQEPDLDRRDSQRSDPSGPIETDGPGGGFGGPGLSGEILRSAPNVETSVSPLTENRDPVDNDPVLKEAADRAQKEQAVQPPAAHNLTGEKAPDVSLDLAARVADPIERTAATEQGETLEPAPSDVDRAIEKFQTALASGMRGAPLAALATELLGLLEEDEKEKFRPLIEKAVAKTNSGIPVFGSSESNIAYAPSSGTSLTGLDTAALSPLKETTAPDSLASSLTSEEGKDLAASIAALKLGKKTSGGNTSSLLDSLYQALNAEPRSTGKATKLAGLLGARPGHRKTIDLLRAARGIFSDLGSMGGLKRIGLALGAAAFLLLLFPLLRRKRKDQARRIVLGWLILFSGVFGGAAIGGSLPTRGGDADGFGGGDPVDRRLAEAGRELTRSLTLLRFGEERKSSCVVSCGPGDPPAFCRSLKSLSGPQARECGDLVGLLVEKALGGLLLNHLALKSVTTPLLVGERAVAAKTKLGETGTILFHRPSVEKLGDPELVALLAHELGHQLVVHGLEKPLSDDAPTKTFGSGRALLDAAGAAIALFGARHVAPQQRPQRLPMILLSLDTCRAVRDFKSSFAAGVLYDTRSELPGAVDVTIFSQRLALSNSRVVAAREGVSSRPARRKFLAGVFQRLLERSPSEEEESALTTKLAEGTPPVAIFAALVGDPEFARKRSLAGDADFVDIAVPLLIGRSAKAEERGMLMGYLADLSRPGAMMKYLSANEDFFRNELKSWYSLYLNRLPLPGEERNHLSRLRLDGNLDAVRAEILATEEYFALQGSRWADACFGKQ